MRTFGLLLLLGICATAASPSGDELFRDDFESGSTKWMVTQGTCAIMADETSVYTCELGTNEARALAGSSWGEYSVQARVRINALDDARS